MTTMRPEISMETTVDVSPIRISKYAVFLKFVFQNNLFIDTYLSWLYGQSPYGPAVCFNAYADGELVGHLAALPRAYDVGGREVSGLLIVNTAVDETFVRHGIFAKLIKCLKDYARTENEDFILGIPNRNALNGWVRRGKAHHLGCLDLFVRPFAAPKPVRPVLTFTKNDDMLAWLSNDPVHERQVTQGGIHSKYGVMPYALFSIFSSSATSKLRSCLGPSLLNGYLGKGPVIGASFKLPQSLKPSPLHIILITDKEDILEIFRTHDIQGKDFDAT